MSNVREAYLEQRGSSGNTQHNKCYRITDTGTQVLTSWGPVGSERTPESICDSTDDAVRRIAFDRQLAAKKDRKNNPYSLISLTENGVVQTLEQRPSDDGRRWGFELETHSRLSIEDIVAKMRERGLDVQVRVTDYFKSNGNQWDVKRDASCGYEFASPILSGERGIFDVKIAAEKIREVCQSAVNSDCGIHVTIGVEDHGPKDLKRLAIGYLRAQEHFYAECNSSRQNNHYCKRNPVDHLAQMITERDVKRVIDMAGGWRNHSDRYHGMNWTRVFSKKVIEFRMLESTVAVRKIGAWIEMCVGFVDGLMASGATFKSTTPFSKETFDQIVAKTWRP